MVSDNILWDVKPCYYMVKNETSHCFSIIVKRWHSLDPLCEVVYRYDDVTMPPGLIQVTCSKFNPPLGERTNNNDREHVSRMCLHLPREYLKRVALLDRLNAILD
jgi:hypothetical protein